MKYKYSRYTDISLTEMRQTDMIYKKKDFRSGSIYKI